MNGIRMKARIVMTARGDFGESNLDRRKQTNALSDLVAERSKYPFLICVFYRQGVIELPVHNVRLWKVRTFGSGAIAQSGHRIVPRLSSDRRALRKTSAITKQPEIDSRNS